jgi:hypothetical protein
MSEKEQYKILLTEIVKKQVIILGPDISVLKARNVKELTITDDGTITDIEGEPSEALQKLINEYVNLSGLIVKNIVGTIMNKYPNIKISGT